jgi:hypothetical protein
MTPHLLQKRNPDRWATCASPHNNLTVNLKIGTKTAASAKSVIQGMQGF